MSSPVPLPVLASVGYTGYTSMALTGLITNGRNVAVAGASFRSTVYNEVAG